MLRATERTGLWVRGVQWAAVALILSAALAGCPKPKPAAPAKRQVREEKFPWRLWSRRVDAPMLVVLSTKKRTLAVTYDKSPLDLTAKPTGLAGLDPETGDVLWTKALSLALARPNVPWSFQIARNGRVVAVWLAGNKLMGIDLYTGEDFWDTPRPNSFGVSKLGFGFVTLWGKKLYYLKPDSGKVDHIFDLPGEASWPAVVTSDGQLLVLCDTTVAELDVNTGKVLWSKNLTLPDARRPIRLASVQDNLLVDYQTLPRVDTTNVQVLDPKTLKPIRLLALPGRVRTHDALFLVGRTLFLKAVGNEGGETLYRLDLAKGKLLGSLKPKSLSHCVPGGSLIYCPYKKGTEFGIAALDASTLAPQWTWQTVDDVSGHRHLWHKGIFYLAGTGKVLGLDNAGKVVFKANVERPGLSLEVNQVLGIVGNVLLATAVDWTKNPTVGTIWAFDVTTGKKLWTKKLPAAIYTTESVTLVGKRVYYADAKFIHVLRVRNGRQTDQWPTRLPGKVSQPPRLRSTGAFVYGVRVNALAAYRLEDGRPIWKTNLQPGMRVVGATGDFVVAVAPSEKLLIWNLKAKKTWNLDWKDPADPKVVLAGDRLVLGGHDASFVLDTKTGKKAADFPAIRHLLALASGRILAIGVTRRIPKIARRLAMFGVTRTASGAKVVPLWTKDFPRKPAGTTMPLWVDPVGALVFTHDPSPGRCVHALGADDGKQRWSLCDFDLPAPPGHYGVKLYAATGPFDPSKPKKAQGLLAIDPDTGKYQIVFPFPGRTDKGAFVIHQVGPIEHGVVHLLTEGPRLRAVKVAH